MSRLASIVGQDALVSRLRALKDFYQTKGMSSEHILLVGPGGTGKNTLACAFAEDCGVSVKVTSGALLDRKSDLSAVLTSIEAREILLIEEIHRLRQPVRELLPFALADFQINLIIGIGPEARVHPYKLNHFTCIGTVPREADCPPDLRELFPVCLLMSKYSESEIQRIAQIIAAASNLSIAPSAFSAIAKASGGSPHQTEMLIRRLSRTGKKEITENDATEILSLLGLQGRASAFVKGHPIDLEQLSGVQFEELIASVLQRMGFRAEITQASGDGGIDIVAMLERPVVGGRYLIQCKRFAADSLVGVSIVREFYGAVTADRKAVKGVLITTSAFTTQAREFAESVGLELIDGEKLSNLLSIGPVEESH